MKKIGKDIARRFKNWKGAKETDMEKPKTSDTLADIEGIKNVEEQTRN